jgi:3-dehydroquinate dehydratase
VALSPEEVDIIIDALQTWSAALGTEVTSPNAAYTHAMVALADRLVTVRGTV